MSYPSMLLMFVPMGSCSYEDDEGSGSYVRSHLCSRSIADKWPGSPIDLERKWLRTYEPLSPSSSYEQLPMGKNINIIDGYDGPSSSSTYHHSCTLTSYTPVSRDTATPPLHHHTFTRAHERRTSLTPEIRPPVLVAIMHALTTTHANNVPRLYNTTNPPPHHHIYAQAQEQQQHPDAQHTCLQSYGHPSSSPSYVH